MTLPRSHLMKDGNLSPILMPIESYLEKKFPKFEDKIGVHFTNPDVLVQAFVHRSYLNETRDFPLAHNERMEFLGDAVLELVVTEFLFNNYLNPEGELTNWRASLVNSRMLAKIGNDIAFEDCLYLSKGEAKDTGKARQFILANAMEALIGAIYMDQGWELAKYFIERFVLSQLAEVFKNKSYLDPKSRFQELAQEKAGVTPVYKVLGESGPDHAKTFEIGLFLGNEIIAKGSGLSKQEAQEEAARNGLEAKGWLK